MDWNDLASSNLPTLGFAAGAPAASPAYSTSGGAGGTPLNRNLSMLQVAGQSLLSSGFGGGAGGGAPTASAAVHPFPQQAPAFSGGGGGAPLMMGSPPPAAQSTAAGLPQPLLRPLESLEDVIKRHENELMDGIVSRMEEETRRTTDAAVEAQLQAAWEADRAAWMQEHCGMMGGTSTTAATTTALTPLALGNGGAAASGGRLVDASLSPYRSPDPRGFLSGPTAGTPLEESLVQAHLKVVQNMKKSSTNGVSTSTIEEFVRILEGRPDPPTQGYSAAWHLVAQLMRSSGSNHNSNSAAVSQAKATLAHFCQQYRTHVLTTVRRSAASTSSSRYANDVTAQCEAYARLQLGGNFTTAPSSASSPPWPVIYFCLRCGDAVAALEAVQTAAGGGAMMDPAVERIVATLARAQGNDASSLWESATVTANDGGGGGLLRLLDPTDMQSLADLLDSAKRMEQQPNNDNKVHEMGVYALLSAASDQPISSDTVEGFRRIEDYLTGALWRAVLRPNPVDELIELGEMIQNWGASYFDDSTSGGWSFALPLLASQQYQKALQWLARSSRTGLLQAAHLGLVLSTAGVPIDNLGTQQDSVPDDAVASLLVAYASELLPMPGGSLAALTYLMRIPNEARARKEVAKLIANTSEMAELVGTQDTEGMRQGGAIGEHFSATEISSILVDATDMILAGSKDDKEKTAMAALCLMLAERYGDLLSLLNETLSPPDQPDDARKFWLENVKIFRSNYIDKRTHVLEVLEREGKQSVVRTNRVLLDLNKFFDRFQSPLRDSETLAIAENLQLLPTSDIDRQVKESEYKNMDPLIQQVYPALLDGAMRILHEEHQRLKMNLHRDTSGVVRERLRELQAKAKLYTTFAASIGMANEHIGSLSHHASLMI